MITFRCDDVSINTDMEKLEEILKIILLNFNPDKILLGVSPAVCSMGENPLEKERIYPKILNAYSDNRVFYKIDKIGIPNIPILPKIQIATHGLVHADHRLMTKEAQELSIVMSSNLLKTNIFIPPFNKWDKNTIDVCYENNIELIKFESGWKHLIYNEINKEGLYYFHTHDKSIEWFRGKLK